MITNRATATRRPLGVILYQGPSSLDGEPVVTIATGLQSASDNRKTGDMIQTWIIRSDVNPFAAIHSGLDASVCGDCPLRGVIERNGPQSTNRRRACYVAVHQAPLAVFQAYQRGRYEPFDVRQHLNLFRNRMLRIGSYGDPVAVPFSVWSPLVAVAAGHTGYTHAWRETRFWRYRRILMASCESLDDATAAHARGWRTFRTGPIGELPVRGEFRCPASAEEGKRLTCERCGACNGANANPGRASVLIQAHGSPATLGSYRRMLDSQ